MGFFLLALGEYIIFFAILLVYKYEIIKAAPSGGVGVKVKLLFAKKDLDHSKVKLLNPPVQNTPHKHLGE